MMDERSESLLHSRAEWLLELRRLRDRADCLRARDLLDRQAIVLPADLLQHALRLVDDLRGHLL